MYLCLSSRQNLISKFQIATPQKRYLIRRVEIMVLDAYIYIYTCIWKHACDGTGLFSARIYEQYLKRLFRTKSNRPRLRKTRDRFILVRLLGGSRWDTVIGVSSRHKASMETPRATKTAQATDQPQKAPGATMRQIIR